jgi:hypothetical protein
MIKGSDPYLCLTDPDPDPRGPKTFVSTDPNPQHLKKLSHEWIKKTFDIKIGSTHMMEGKVPCLDGK